MFFIGLISIGCHLFSLIVDKVFAFLVNLLFFVDGYDFDGLKIWFLVVLRCGNFLKMCKVKWVCVKFRFCANPEVSDREGFA